jgi:hypothetical protein
MPKTVRFTEESKRYFQSKAEYTAMFRIFEDSPPEMLGLLVEVAKKCPEIHRLVIMVALS